MLRCSPHGDAASFLVLRTVFFIRRAPSISQSQPGASTICLLLIPVSYCSSARAYAYFGEKAAQEHLAAELNKVGSNVLLAYGGGSVKRNGVYDELTQILREAGKRIVEFTGIMPNPTYAKVQEGAKLAREEKIDFILAVGGDSVIDCCKIVSAQAKTDRDIWNMQYTNHQFPTSFIPLGAVVTAFGTGAEMNNGAVITNEDKGLYSIRYHSTCYFFCCTLHIPDISIGDSYTETRFSS